MKIRLAYDPVEALAHLRLKDPRLAELIDRIGPFTLKLRPVKSLFEALLRSITYQQLHGRAAEAIHGRVIAELAKRGGITPESLAQTSDEILRGAGLSANKLAAVRDLGAKCHAGTVPSLREAHGLDDGELITRLTQVRGIGPWTVHILLIFYLGRSDILPTGDFAIRLALKKLHKKRKNLTEAAMLRLTQPWQPYRSLASWYLWRSLD